MKKFLYIISSALAAVYVIVFSLNAPQFAARHMGDEIFYPVIAGVCSLFAALVMLAANKFKPIDKKLFFIPLLFLACSAVTLAVGYNTVCEFCAYH
ncbi:MAG: hypothetical protein IJW21_08815 [Clostridia bacterium]|nr:hypothetical protein [Clostridia bacterium]